MDQQNAQSLLETYFLQQKHLQRYTHISSSLLVVGSQGLPTLEAAKYLAQSRLCEQREKTPESFEPPCGHCPSCVSAQKSQNLRIKIVEPQGTFIKVEQAREVIEKLSLRSDRKQVVILHQAHKLNVQAANALLKTLEEPPEQAWILLTAPSARNILPTIRSRVVVCNLPPLSHELVSQAVHPKSNISKSNGSNSNYLQGRWDRLLVAEDFLAGMQDLQDWLKKASQMGSEVEPLSFMETKEGLLEALSHLRLLAKEHLLQTSTEASLGGHQEGNNLETKSRWLKFLSEINQYEEACLQNADRKLVMDHLYMSIEDLKPTDLQGI